MRNAILFCCCMSLVLSCKKNSVEQAVPAPTPLITAVGTREGSAVSKQVGAAGGTLASADGRIKVEIPAGALGSEQAIIIQPITNTLDFGIGLSYRITPHNVSFQKPVRITFSYTDAEVKNTNPEMLAIGYQNVDGSWKAVGGVQIDKTNRTATVSTSHFSDWGFFPFVYLQPTDARVNTSEELDMTVMSVTPEGAPSSEPGEKTVAAPFEMPASYILKWNYSGTGSLQANGAKAHYKAPAQVPAANPEAVSVEIKMQKPGTYLIVSNITVLSKFHIDYLQVDETETTIPNTSSSRLYIYGNFGDDPGATIRSVKIGVVPLTVIFWTPHIIACELTTSGPTSSGEVKVSNGASADTKLLNEWLVDLMYEKRESPDGSLTKRAKLVLRFRGDADGFFRDGEQSWISYTDLNVSSKAIITMSAGSFTTHTTMDGCADYTVRWDALTDVQIPRVLYSQSSKYLGGRIVNLANGFKVKLRFMSDDILQTTRIMVPCRGQSTTDKVKDNISLQGYHEADYYFKFSRTGRNASILAGAMPRLNGTEVAAGLFFDYTDLNMQLFYTTLTWAEAAPKYQ